jgi:hypothetical protein
MAKSHFILALGSCQLLPPPGRARLEGCFPRGLVPVGAAIDSYLLDTRTRIVCFSFRLSVRLARAGVTCFAWVLFQRATLLPPYDSDGESMEKDDYPFIQAL